MTSTTVRTLPTDEKDDFPIPGPLIPALGGPMCLPAIVYGAGAFSNQYNSDAHIASQLPFKTVRLALRYGIKAFDTSVYYGPSEIVLGNVLQALHDEFPRTSYQLMTKCGRYGVSKFDYSPENIRRSVMQSLDRLKTNYLDTVYLHDVEFVATPILPKPCGNHASALKADVAAYGLADGDEAKIRGEGDQKVLYAFHELQKLQEEGLVKNIGITGFPLPTLLRLTILIAHTPPFRPVDVLLSYSHLCLQNSTLLEFLPHFQKRAKVKQVVAASPLSMGLLTPSPPSWHPAPPDLRLATANAIRAWGKDFPQLAVGYSMRKASAYETPLPLAIGFSSPTEVHEAVGAWRRITDSATPNDNQKGEEITQNIFEEAGYLDWSWASP